MFMNFVYFFSFSFQYGENSTWRWVCVFYCAAFFILIYILSVSFCLKWIIIKLFCCVFIHFLRTLLFKSKQKKRCLIPNPIGPVQMSESKIWFKNPSLVTASCKQKFSIRKFIDNKINDSFSNCISNQKGKIKKIGAWIV